MEITPVQTPEYCSFCGKNTVRFKELVDDVFVVVCCYCGASGPVSYSRKKALLNWEKDLLLIWKHTRNLKSR